MTGPAAYRMVASGPSALLLEVADAAAALSLAEHLREEVDATDVVPGACTVLVDGAEPSAVAGAVERWDPTADPDHGPLVEVPVVYDGADLAAVADVWGCTVREVVERHTSLELVSAFCGFAPGFAYLSGVPDEWSVPRLESPRPRVPAGSVALAGTWSAVYPTASPGGWRLLGRTDVALWDTRRTPPALLAPGTRVAFREVRP
ncbi:allophanate hydrolase subunit 1 [Nocardioides sp. REDSEA-S30_B4]|uniref:5-oxoprolinase subunit B family protein n=1 Tax=Nocardioides sp. REDSEA-S30_B4 TaxID=1811552 RepID=UPI000B21D5DF|nr:allophanate hydrolase subunit 1 [Nocardioides sp. REDSEA-S30_B4]